MSGSRESSLWRWLAKAKLTLRTTLHMSRVENDVGSGMPDVEGKLYDAYQFWIELKSAARPKRPDTPVRFKVRDGQVEWLRRRSKVGGSCWLLLQVGSSAAAERYLVPGHLAGEVQNGVDEARLAQMCQLRRFGVLGPPKSPADVIRRAAGGAF